MATYSKQFLSGSTSGKGIKLSTTASPGTLIHTSHATGKDEIWLYAYNGHTADVVLTLQFGGTTAVDNDIILSVAFKSGLALVVPGLILSGSSVVRAYAATTAVITLSGYVNRIL
jgi:hypothetical protein